MKKAVIISILLLSCLLFVAQNIGSSNSGNRALLIGIDRYLYTNDLIGTENDVSMMQELLIQYKGFKLSEITTLLNEEATFSNINKEMERLAKETRKGDKILFYFSGHGFQIDDANGDEPDNKDEVLITHDASYNGDEHAPLLASLNMITDDQLALFFNQLDDRNVEVIVDACHSGSITKAPKNSTSSTLISLSKLPQQFISPKHGKVTFRTKNVVKPLLSPEQNKKLANSIIPSTHNRKVWTAASAHEIAFIDIREVKRPVSVFTYSFVQGIMQQKADSNLDGEVTDKELLNYAKDQSREYCFYLQNIRQLCSSLIPTFNHLP